MSSLGHRAPAGNCCHTHLQSSSAFCIVQTQQGQIELSAQSSECSSWRSFPVTPNLHTSYPTQPVSWNKEPTQVGNTDVSKTCWSLPMPLLILTVFGFVKLYLCSTMAWYCLVNQVQSTDQFWPFTACTAEGLSIWRNHQPHKSLSYQQQSLYSLPRESWRKCALQQKQYIRGAAEPTT